VAIHNQTSRCRSVGTRRPAPDRQVVDRQFHPRCTPRHQPGDNCHRGLFMSRKRISSAQTRSASTRLHDPDQITPVQQIRELLRVGDRLISVAVVYARLSAALDRENAGQQRPSDGSYPDVDRPRRRVRRSGSSSRLVDRAVSYSSSATLVGSVGFLALPFPAATVLGSTAPPSAGSCCLRVRSSSPLISPCTRPRSSNSPSRNART
jgi:hypothetical protein